MTATSLKPPMSGTLISMELLMGRSRKRKEERDCEAQLYLAVIPAKAGIHVVQCIEFVFSKDWIPAFAG
jgi:hypothetical protein